MLEQFDFVEAKIRELGLEINPSSRLALERRVFMGPDGTNRTVFKTDDGFRTALECMRDYQLFEYILESAAHLRPTQLVERKIELALKDAVDPTSSQNTVGRDTQVELFMAVVLHHAWLEPRFLAAGNELRPDLRTTIERVAFDVEVKRVKSEKKLLDAVEHGIKQIQESGCPGALYVDTSLAFNPKSEVDDQRRTDAQYEREHSARLNRNIRVYERELHSLLDRKRTTGILFQDHRIRRRTETQNELVSVMVMFENRCSGPKHRSAWVAFQRAINRGGTRYAREA